ncbi:AHH domain-containing protein [Telmatocola sphagniphila]|uniref:AHH domain-containing protein n=1 Tax=Telmatocola sphagniphila TaxID=1123043 RepID=A0A8E6B3S3_9BACT|nr:AHH domain-containing protein [Telmatocola sphagniphila]QVL31347.1 AHH domain-containing protein [Telmatocola sphagniphila]
MRIADHHTYFVGDESWGWEVWSHNSICSVLETEEAGLAFSTKALRVSEIHHIASEKSAKIVAAFTEILRKAELSLQSAFNKNRVAWHVSPHGVFYNQYIFKRLTDAVGGTTGSTYRAKLLDELWQLRREIQNGDLGFLLRDRA